MASAQLWWVIVSPLVSSLVGGAVYANVIWPGMKWKYASGYRIWTFLYRFKPYRFGDGLRGTESWNVASDVIERKHLAGDLYSYINICNIWQPRPAVGVYRMLNVECWMLDVSWRTWANGALRLAVQGHSRSSKLVGLPIKPMWDFLLLRLPITLVAQQYS